MAHQSSLSAGKQVGKQDHVDMPRPGSILVAEDEHILARSLTSDLTELGYEVFGPEPNGERAVAHAREKRPDMALLDIRMPKLDGLSAAELLYQEMQIPVVILSAFSDPPYLKAGTRNGVFGYLLKPVSLDELRVTLTIAWARYLDQVKLSDEVTHLNKKLEDRKVIERAKGILMQTRGFTEEQAMKHLQKQARDSRRPMVDIARVLLDAQDVIKGCCNPIDEQGDGKPKG